ncbi:MAG: hypothetical protein IPP25_02505 [Saprospiraceae bacterium]|nr:hypothetical protein [Candidatus Opimibacter skivensis]
MINDTFGDLSEDFEVAYQLQINFTLDTAEVYDDKSGIKTSMSLSSKDTPMQLCSVMVSNSTAKI